MVAYGNYFMHTSALVLTAFIELELIEVAGFKEGYLTGRILFFVLLLSLLPLLV